MPIVDGKLKIRASKLFRRIRDAKVSVVGDDGKPHKVQARVIVNEGGARSSKTYSALQCFITDAFTRTGAEYDIIRGTLPALKASAMKDFFAILKNEGLYHEADHNKSENTYLLHGNTFNFYSADNAQKLRGRKRTRALMNEANEMLFEDFAQLDLRTEEQILLDYNPSEEESWIYDKVIPRKDCAFIHSTYKDNPFLPKSIVGAIEGYQEEDGDYWKIYGLGQRGKLRGKIYEKIFSADEFPEFVEEEVYGLDFGYNPDPTVLVRVGRIGMRLFVEQLIYDRDLTNSDLIARMEELNVRRNVDMYADSAEPDRIEEIGRAGYSVNPADKGQGSVKFGIDVVKRYEIYIVKESVETLTDFRAYKWKVDRNGKTVSPPTPVHAFSHSPDAVRYAAATHWGHEFRNLKEDDLEGVSVGELETVAITRMF